MLARRNVMSGATDPTEERIAEHRRQHEERVSRFRQLQQSAPYQDQIRRLHRLRNDFVYTVAACWKYATRIPEFVDRSFLMRNTDDLIESAVILTNAIENGARNPARRESRYLLELIVKALYVDQHMPRSNFDTRRAFFDRRVSKSGVRPEVDDLQLDHVPENIAQQIIADIKAAFGRASQYVHPSVLQIDARVQLASQNITVGYDSPDTLRAANDELFEVFSLVLVLSFHGVGDSTWWRHV